jgi:hypothetical protein
MTTKEVLKGLRFRLKSLKETVRVVTKVDEHSWSMVVQDYETRIDEVETLIEWIERKK